MKLYFTTLLIFILINSLYPQYPNIRVSNPANSDPNEVSIAINPLNPDILAAGANLRYFYRSTDAGLTWAQSSLTSTLGVWGDPCVIFDGLGNLYFAHLSNPLNGYWIDRIVVQRSTDNGLTWNDGAGVGYTYPKNQDKEWLAVDLHSQHKNNIYMSWTEFDSYGSANPNDSSRILFSRSTDQGITWDNPVRISDTGGDCIDSDNTVEGAVPAVGINGEVFISWAGPLGILFDRSFDGGVTFGTDIFISDMPGGWNFNVPGIYRCNGFPVTLSDTSQSPFRGTIYVVWGDQRNGLDNSDVFMKKSTDNGTTWSSLIKVNNDNTTRHQFFPWATIDQATGILYVVFYDRRNTTGAATDVYIARSTDGGESFENFKISQSSFTPNQNVFFGDYTNIAAFNRKVYPIWTRLDNTTLSIWTAPFYDSSLVVPVELHSFTANLSDKNIILSWKTLTEKNNYGFEIERRTGDGDWVTAGFVKGSGTTLRENNYQFTDKPEAAGYYYYRLKQIDLDGTFAYHGNVEINFWNIFSFALEQNYPNPFNPTTTIGYSIPEKCLVTIKIYDIMGNEVASLLNEEKEAGIYEIEFRTSKAEGLSSGIYFYKMSARNFSEVRKMNFVK
jgi:hypothetical protein